jgi:TolB protein
VGYNVYRATASHGNYEKANSALLTTTMFVDRLLDAGTTYYYVVTAVDVQGLESNFSAEVRDDANNRAS